jgi:hypothetical protein
VTTGEVPRNVLFSVYRYLVQTIVPGIRSSKAYLFICYSGGQVHPENAAVFILQPEGCCWS